MEREGRLVRSRPLALALLVVAVGALALAWGVGRNAVPAGALPGAGSHSPPETTTPRPLPIDPRGLRDVFRFADAPSPPARAQTGPAAGPANEPTPVPGPRLVGLVWRSGRLIAALAIDGEVVLAAAGEAVAGVTVVSVEADAVRVRRPDGTEETLTLP